MRSTFEQENEDYAFVSEISVETMDMWLEHCAVDDLIDEFVLRITPEGFRVLAVGPAQVGMVDTTLHKEAFESHRAGTDGIGQISVGIVLEKLQNVVDTITKSDAETVTLAFDQETGRVHIKGGGIKRSIALIATDSIRNQSELPDIDLPTCVTISSSAFKTGYTSCDLVSDQIVIMYDDDERGIFFYSEGDNDDNRYDPAEQQVHESGPARTMLSSDYVEKIEKVARKKRNPSEEVVLELGEDVPMKFHINIEEEIGGETFKTIDTTYCIAPRIDEKW